MTMFRFLSWCGIFVCSATAFLVQSPCHRSGPCRAPLTQLGLSTVVDISQSTQRDVGAMDDWAAAYGVQRVGGFQYASEDGEDISVMTTDDIPASNPVLFVPSALIFSSNLARQELDGPGIEAGEALLDNLGIGDERPQFALFLKVLVEYEKGDASPWFPWLNAMPRTYYNGASMTRMF